MMECASAEWAEAFKAVGLGISFAAMFVALIWGVTRQ